MQEQELFQGYEVKNWDFSPRIYKILAASAIFNVLALLGIAQTNLLTTKGCDSPLVGGVCQVLDTLYVGGTVLATDTTYIDGPGTKTELDDAEIIWVDRTGEDKFNYPEGYFALSNPEKFVPQEIANPDGSFPSYIPGMPNPTDPTTGGAGGTGDLLSKPQELPKNNPGAIVGPLPDSPIAFDNNPTTVKPPRPQPWKKPKQPKTNPALGGNDSPTKLPDDPATAVNEPNPKATPNPAPEGIKIDRTRMTQFATEVKQKVRENQVDLTSNFKVVADGVLTNEGKFDVTEDKKTKQKKSRVVAAEGNEQMVAVVKQAIEAVGDSGWLGYLKAQGIDKINFTVAQDNDNLQVIITSDLPSPERANTVTSGLNTIIQAALLADKNNWKKLGDDERTLLSQAKVAVNPGNTKQFVLNFVLPKPVVQEMITRRLNETETTPAEPKKNGGSARLRETDRSAGK